MSRQLKIYDIVSGIKNDVICSPTEIMSSLGISRRMLQRDLEDIRDCGLINVKYNKTQDRYVLNDKPSNNDKVITPRRMQHLVRLHRIGTLLHSLSRTDTEDFDRFENGVEIFEEYLEDVKDDLENNSPEDIEMMKEFYIPQDFEFYDLKAEYYALFPDSNERTRQRDFEEMNRAGFNIYYSRKYRSFIYLYDFRQSS